MKKAILIGLISAIVLLLASCPDPNPTDNTNTVSTPTASPTSGTHTMPMTVSLNCSTSGASIYYTLDSTTPTASSTPYTTPISITQTTTIKAIAIKDGMDDSQILTATYTKSENTDPGDDPDPNTDPECDCPNGTVHTDAECNCDAVGFDCTCTYDPQDEDTYTITALGTGGPSAVLVVPKTAGEKATLTVNGDPTHYSAVSIEPLNSHITADLTGRTAEVSLRASGEADISLAYVHYIRTALTAKGATSVTVTEHTTFTPVFDGRDWWTHDGESTVINLYENYSTNTQLMNGIQVMHNSPYYYIEYDRSIKISQPVWQNNIVYSEDRITAPFQGFGLKKKNNSSAVISLSDITDNTVISGGDKYERFEDFFVRYPVVYNFPEYLTALAESGLSPADGILLDHSSVRVNGVGDNPNITANGIYDFILPYANDDKYSLLPKWPITGYTVGAVFSDLTFNAIDNGDTITRTIGGVVCDNPLRKGDTNGMEGRPNANFVGSVTVAMVNYLIKSTGNGGMGITEFRNTNIIGNGEDLSQQIGTNGTPFGILVNVGFIGDYSDRDWVFRTSGVIDITGPIPENNSGAVTRTMRNNNDTGYLNIWSSVSGETILDGFRVVILKDTQVNHKVRTSAAFDAGADVIVYPKKYAVDSAQATIGSGVEMVYRPAYVAFITSSGAIKLTGTGSGITFDSAYLGKDSSRAVPELNETTWIQYANNGENPPALAPNYTALSADYKFASVEEFEGLETE